jgi:hypothetical protein
MRQTRKYKKNIEETFNKSINQFRLWSKHDIFRKYSIFHSHGNASVPPFSTTSCTPKCHTRKLSFYIYLGGKPFQEHGACCNVRLWNHSYKSSDVKYSNSRRDVQRNDQIGISTCSCQMLLEYIFAARILKREMRNS